MAARPFTRRQALQNQAFLEALGEAGNPRLAARLLGVHRSTYQKRRAKSAAFAQDWDAALAAAHACFHEQSGPRGPEGTVTFPHGEMEVPEPGKVTVPIPSAPRAASSGSAAPAAAASSSAARRRAG
jgi:hypothetical protein